MVLLQGSNKVGIGFLCGIVWQQGLRVTLKEPSLEVGRGLVQGAIHKSSSGCVAKQ